MKPSPRISLLALRDCLARGPSSSSSSSPALYRTLHTKSPSQADVVPVYGTGPPPEPPQPARDDAVARRKRQAEMIKKAKEIRAAANKNNKPSTLKKRFWEHVYVVETEDGQQLQINLDKRPLRHPTTKEPIKIPASKRHLADALALEWDLLTSALQATKVHFIPMTSLVCRAIDIAADDAQAQDGVGQVRRNIIEVMMRYLDTDSLLCLAPPPDPDNPILQSSALNDEGESLREVQERSTIETIAWLTTHVWPGVEINLVLDGESIMPKSQKPGVREIIQGWVTGLNEWELAGLERGVLASKSLLTAARLVAEWSEGDAGVGKKVAAERQFGVEEAAKVASVEVDWQIGRWGEVEDTHDVEKEDLRRQLGSVILLVSGTGIQ
ncbi:ATP12 chaperone [Coniochaeta sp. 2T2.1]|nr:ATP12 chaperone [Coniochaeta sp. 2T2.1]